MGTDLGEAGNLSCPWLRTVYALLEINLEDAQDLAKLRFWSAHAHWGADPPVCVCVGGGADAGLFGWTCSNGGRASFSPVPVPI